MSTALALRPLACLAAGVDATFLSKWLHLDADIAAKLAEAAKVPRPAATQRASAPQQQEQAPQQPEGKKGELNAARQWVSCSGVCAFQRSAWQGLRGRWTHVVDPHQARCLCMQSAAADSLPVSAAHLLQVWTPLSWHPGCTSPPRPLPGWSAGPRARHPSPLLPSSRPPRLSRATLLVSGACWAEGLQAAGLYAERWQALHAAHGPLLHGPFGTSSSKPPPLHPLLQTWMPPSWPSGCTWTRRLPPRSC